MSDLSQSLALSALSVSSDAHAQPLRQQPDILHPIPMTLDDLLIAKPVSTVIFPVRDPSAAEYGLNPGDLLIVDRHAMPANNQLVIISANDELIISRYSNSSDRTSSNLPEAIDNVTNLHIWGVVTYIICKQ
jgi:SOS-response transcriptional repressors (RecA-mediated autopeptidases)